MRYMKSSEQSGVMQGGICNRCGGLMVPGFTDSLSLEVTESVRNPSWRCVNCGEWLDETIVSNRLRRQQSGFVSTESPPSSHRRRWRRQSSLDSA